MKAELFEPGRGAQAVFLPADDQRMNRSGRSRIEERSELPQFLSPPVSLRAGAEIKSSGGRGGRGCRRRGRKNKTARFVDQIFDQATRPCDVAARAAESLAQSAHLHLDAIGQAKLIGQPASASSENADRVGFIKYERGAVFVLQLDDVAQRGKIAVHAEDRFRRDENASLRIFLPRPLQMMLQMLGVVVMKRPEPCAAQARSVDKTCVRQTVEENDVMFARERLDCADAGGVTAAEDQSGLRRFEGGDLFLQLRVRALCSSDQTGGAGSGSVVACGPNCRFDHIGVRGKSEVVVRGEVVPFPSVHRKGSPSGCIGNAQAPPQVACVQIVERLLQRVSEHGGRTMFNRTGRGVHRGEGLPAAFGGGNLAGMLHLPDPVHPFAVHFPVAFLLLAVAFLSLSLLWPNGFVVRVAVLAALLGALGATWAHSNGLAEARAIRYVAAPVVEAVSSHRHSSDLMMYGSWLLAAAAVAVFFLRKIPVFSVVSRLVAVALSLFVLWSMQAALHSGSELTHKHFFGPNAPKPMPGTEDVVRLHVD